MQRLPSVSYSALPKRCNSASDNMRPHNHGVPCIAHPRAHVVANGAVKLMMPPTDRAELHCCIRGLYTDLELAMLRTRLETTAEVCETCPCSVCRNNAQEQLRIKGQDLPLEGKAAESISNIRALVAARANRASHMVTGLSMVALTISAVNATHASTLSEHDMQMRFLVNNTQQHIVLPYLCLTQPSTNEGRAMADTCCCPIPKGQIYVVEYNETTCNFMLVEHCNTQDALHHFRMCIENCINLLTTAPGKFIFEESDQQLWDVIFERTPQAMTKNNAQLTVRDDTLCFDRQTSQHGAAAGIAMLTRKPLPSLNGSTGCWKGMLESAGFKWTPGTTSKRLRSSVCDLLGMWLCMARCPGDINQFTSQHISDATWKKRGQADAVCSTKIWGIYDVATQVGAPTAAN